MKAPLQFVVAFFAELIRLSLVLAGAAVGVRFLAGGLEGLLVYAVYCLFTLVPARDLAQGWLGMLAGRVPKRFDDRVENLGRGLCGLLTAIAWVAILVSTFHAHSDSAELDALTFAFVLLSMLVFGAGTAIPRLWFATRRPPARRPDGDVVPPILDDAAKRAARFFLFAFVGIGTGMLAAIWGSAARAVAHPPPPPPPRRNGDLFSMDSACRPPTDGCPTEQRRTFVADRAGRAHVKLYATSDDPLCRVRPDGAWPAGTPWTQAVDAALNGPYEGWPSGEADLPVAAGESLRFVVTVRDGDRRCRYTLEVAQP